MNAWFYLAGAILFEVAGTTCMKLSRGFTELVPSVMIFVFYACAFALNTVATKTIELSVAYAIWSGAGVALIALIAWVFFGQALDTPAVIGLALIVAGVVVLNVFSKTVAHS